MFNSTFVLCPRGNGPSSIRVLEAMAAGAIPILIDDYTTPFEDKLCDFAVRWSFACGFSPFSSASGAARPSAMHCALTHLTVVAHAMHDVDVAIDIKCGNVRFVVPHASTCGRVNLCQVGQA